MAGSVLGALLLLAGCWFFLDGLRLESAPQTDRERDEGALTMHAYELMAIGGGFAFAGVMVFFVLFVTRRPAGDRSQPPP